MFTSHHMRVFGFSNIPTYIGGAGQHSSPDLVAVGHQVTVNIEHPQVLDDAGSDHLPILTRVRCEIEKTEHTRSFWCSSTLDREGYLTHLAHSLQQWQKRHTAIEFSPSSAYAEWTECVLEATELFCRKTPCLRRNSSPSWYRSNRGVQQLIRERRRLRKRFQRRRDLVTYRAYQESKNRTDKAIQEAKDKV